MNEKPAFLAAAVACMTALCSLLPAVPAAIGGILRRRTRTERRPARRIAGHRGGFGPVAWLRGVLRQLLGHPRSSRRSGARPLRHSARRSWAERVAAVRRWALWPRLAAALRAGLRGILSGGRRLAVVLVAAIVGLGAFVGQRLVRSWSAWQQRRSQRAPRRPIYAAPVAAVRAHSTRAVAAATARVHSSPTLAAAGERLRSSAAAAATRSVAAEMAALRAALRGAAQTVAALPLVARLAPAVALVSTSLRALPRMAPPRPSKRTFLALAVVTIVAPYLAGADIYKYVDARGHVHLTDRPDHAGYQRLVKTWKGWQQVKVNYRDLAKNRVKYSGTIAQAAKDHRVPPALLHAVITAESAYNPDAISTAGAVGLMQLMPDTAERYGVVNRRDPGANVSGGTRYLHDLLEMFDDNLVLALAAYNAGENAVIKCGRRIPPIKETETYVQRVLQYYNDYKRQM